MHQEKPLDSIETLIAMPRSEFSENQLARNFIAAAPGCFFWWDFIIIHGVKKEFTMKNHETMGFDQTSL